MEFRLKSVEPKNYLNLERLTGHPNCSFRVIRSAQNQGLNNSSLLAILFVMIFLFCLYLQISFQHECHEVRECVEMSVESNITHTELDAVVYIGVFVLFCIRQFVE